MPAYNNGKKTSHIMHNGKRYSAKYMNQDNLYDTKSHLENRISSINTDKSRYSPQGNAKVEINVGGLTSNQGSLQLDLIDNFGLNMFSNTINFSTQGNNTTIYTYVPVQNTDFIGYTLKATLNVNGNSSVATSAIDVSSDWTKYPRYSALTVWNKDPSVVQKDIANLNRLHINSAMYYDAFDRPQNPISNDDGYIDWLGRKINVDTIKAAIQAQHDHGQAAMLYDMICATTGVPSDSDTNMQGNPNFTEITRQDGTQGLESKYGLFSSARNDTNPAAGTYNGAGEQATVNMLAPFNNRSNTDHQVQYYYNPADSGWANYIGNIVANTLSKYDFDGWQGDTPGNIIGLTYDAAKSGNYSSTFDSNSALGDFADTVKQDAMKNYKLSINAVSGSGQDTLNGSNADLMYAEIWFSSGFQFYSHLANFINNVKSNSNKSLIVPAYMYGDYTPSDHQFLNNAILLKDIVIFASGGDSMELVDDMLQLYGAYYPDVTNSGRILPKPSLNDPDTGQLRSLYDFITAYEAVLRNDSLTMDSSIAQVSSSNGGYINSSSGMANSVYTISRSSNTTKLCTLSLINLMGVGNINWQVNNSYDESQKSDIQEQDNLMISYYTNNTISEVYMSSPDAPYNCLPQKLDFQYISGGIQFTIPSLKYWDLIYMRYE